MAKEVTWETITDTLIQEFKQNLYEKDEKMPSENNMAARFGVTRAEIRKAYDCLKEQGYIYSMQGYGSFFSGKGDKIHLTMDNESFSAKMAAQNLPVETETLKCQRLRSDSLLHSMLQVAPSVPVYKLVRLRTFQGEPVAIHISYLPEDLFPDIAKDGAFVTSVYDYLHSHGFPDLASDNTQITVSTLSKKERTLLEIKGYAPGLVLTSRCVARPSGRIVEIARTIYRSDKFVFHLNDG